MDVNEYANPNWDNAGNVHDWRNYASDTVKAIWEELPLSAKFAFGKNLQDIADKENWD